MKKIILCLAALLLTSTAYAEREQMGMPIGTIHGNNTYSKPNYVANRYKYNGMGRQDLLNRNRLISSPYRRFTNPYDVSSKFGMNIQSDRAPNLQPDINRSGIRQESREAREYRSQMREGRRDWSN